MELFLQSSETKNKNTMTQTVKPTTSTCSGSTDNHNLNLQSGEEKWAKHYSNRHKILLVGEGDFSFSASLAAAFGCASNMTATERGLWKVYEDERAVYNIGELMRKGCKVIHGVNAADMDSHPCLKGLKFDRIIFNFPFGVMSKKSKKPDGVPRCPHRVLVKAFLRAAKEMISENGEIHITQRTDGIIGELKIEFLAFQQWLELVGVDDFNVFDYPGYTPKWEIGSGYNNNNLDYFPSRTYKFRCPPYHPTMYPSPYTAQYHHNILPSTRYYTSSYNLTKNNEQLQQQVINTGIVVAEEKWINHYSNRHKMLLVGEGDFSFSASLARAFGSTASNITATSLDSEDFLTFHYCKAFIHLKELKERGCKVIHGVDATSMAYHPSLMGSVFDRIVFNFPYAGFFNDSSRESKIGCHQSMIWMFLENAKQMIGENGEIHITHKTNGFHLQWNIVSLAIQQGLELVGCVEFNATDYPGYSNKYGFGGDNSFDCSHSKTYMFRHPRTTASIMSWPSLGVADHNLLPCSCSSFKLCFS